MRALRCRERQRRRASPAGPAPGGGLAAREQERTAGQDVAPRHRPCDRPAGTVIDTAGPIPSWPGRPASGPGVRVLSRIPVCRARCETDAVSAERQVRLPVPGGQPLAEAVHLRRGNRMPEAGQPCPGKRAVVGHAARRRGAGGTRASVAPVQIGTVAERAEVRAAIDPVDPVVGVTDAPLAVVEVRRPVPGLSQVDLRHHPPEIRTHVAHMIRVVLIPIVFVVPPGLQAFGVPVAHPVSDATCGLDRCRQQNQDRYRQRRREQWLEAERPPAFACSVEPGIPACVPDPRSGPASQWASRAAGAGAGRGSGNARREVLRRQETRPAECRHWRTRRPW